MAGFNWFDLVLILLLLVGMAVGYSQGMVRQVIGLAALYISFVIATQFFQGLSRLVSDLVNAPPTTLANALSFFGIFFLILAIVNFLGIDAYKMTRLRPVPILDHIGGMLLGVVSMWIILTIATNVLIFAVNTQGWTSNAESVRVILKYGLDGSRIAEVTGSTLPMIVATIRPWLPAGIPALFQL